MDLGVTVRTQHSVIILIDFSIRCSTSHTTGRLFKIELNDVTALIEAQIIIWQLFYLMKATI